MPARLDRRALKAAVGERPIHARALGDSIEEDLLAVSADQRLELVTPVQVKEHRARVERKRGARVGPLRHVHAQILDRGLALPLVGVPDCGAIIECRAHEEGARTQRR